MEKREKSGVTLSMLGTLLNYRATLRAGGRDAMRCDAMRWMPGGGSGSGEGKKPKGPPKIHPVYLP
jgi:hypothetical protein